MNKRKLFLLLLPLFFYLFFAFVFYFKSESALFLMVAIFTCFLHLILWATLNRHFIIPFEDLLRRVISFSKDIIPEHQIQRYLAVNATGVLLQDTLEALKKKHSQELSESKQFELLLSGLKTPIIAINEKEQILFSNVSSAQQNTFKQNSLLTELVRKPEVGEAFKKVLGTGLVKKIEIQLFDLMDAKPEPREYTLFINPFVSSSTQIKGALGVFYDITDLKNLLRIKTDLAANISHELKTPLTVIKGYLSTIESDVNLGRFEDISAFLKIVNRNVDRLVLLVNDLLTLSVLESGESLNLTLIDIEEISAPILQDLKKKYSHKNQIIQCDYQVKSVFADRKHLEQIILNLVDNALAHTDTLKQINVQWHEDNTHTILTVKDTGSGIMPDELHKIFERFYRTDKSRAKETGGIGLGLAIVKNAMKAHKGFVTVKSQIGLGTQFDCFFPK